jgi:hypothetical protein
MISIKNLKGPVSMKIQNKKSLFYLILLCLFPIKGFSESLDQAVSNLKHQILDYPQEKIFIQLNKPVYEAGDTLWFRGHTATEAFHLPSSLSRGIFVHMYGPDGKMIENFGLLPIDKNIYSSFIVLPEYLPEGEYMIKAYTERMKAKRVNAYFTEKFRINNPIRKYNQPDEKDKVFITRFYPEGGKILAEHPNEISYITRDKSGKPCNASISVFDNEGKSVLISKTISPGIGRFTLSAEKGKSYHVLVDKDGSKTEYAELPAVSSSSEFGLKVSDMVDEIYVSAAESGKEKISKELNVLVLLRGVPNLQLKLTPEKDFLYIPKSSFSSGVNQFVLLNGKNQVLSERLIFINNSDQTKVDLRVLGDTLRLPGRNSSKISFKITDSTGEPVKGDFSVSIYPEKYKASFEKNILSEFLLSSDLNTDIPYPSDLLQKNDAMTAGIIDSWLIASKWTKFNIQKAIDGELEQSWDSESPEDDKVEFDNTGIYSPLTEEEKALRKEITKTIDLKAVNVTAEQIDRDIKPYSYANHTVSGEDLVEQGATIQDYLVRLPGVTYNYDEDIMLIRNGNVTFLLDGMMVDQNVLREVSASEIKSLDVLKDPANIGFVKFSAKDSSYTGVGGVIAIWTKRAYDVKTSIKKVKVLPAGQKIKDDVKRIIMPGTKDTWFSQYPNLSGSRLWKPYVITDSHGEAVIYFSPYDNNDEYVVEIDGITSNGSLIHDKKLIKIAEK